MTFPFIVHCLISKQRSWIYIGLTSNFGDRIMRNLNGYEQTTKPYRPFVIKQLCFCKDRIEARKVEKWYKTSQGKAIIRLINFLSLTEE